MRGRVKVRGRDRKIRRKGGIEQSEEWIGGLG